MKSGALRSSFLNFFSERGHAVVPSSSLVPSGDPSLLFTNAGMVQFKNVFLGREKLDFSRAASSQRCVRVGGKHNDLDNVGYTERHHTFFEMLGNFSFGDYFKREAIAYAWDYVTRELGLPREKLWITVFEEDRESENLWLKEMGVPPKRFARMKAADNFWSMGTVGPCGPCSEIYYDHGDRLPGRPPGTGDGGDRFVEIWNLVFMQSERGKDGRMTALPRPSVDTGMGLERIAAVMQGTTSNYDTDLFKPLLSAVAEVTQCDDLRSPSARVVADHVRSCCFLIADGVVPANEGRGYVLRRIIRRAVRHGHRLRAHEPFFYRLSETFAEQMGTVYPELKHGRVFMADLLKREEESFRQALQDGLKILEKGLDELSGRQVPAELIFKLYDTYGFPVDLTGDAARERGLSLDLRGFEVLMEEQRARARKHQRFTADAKRVLPVEGSSGFVGYERQRHFAGVRRLFADGEPVESLQCGQSGLVILDETPFYAEAGGQVGDTGVLVSEQARFRVDDTQKQGRVIKHLGVVEDGELKEGDPVEARIDGVRRRRIACNHSATHLLHAALKSVLGSQVQQKGSLVEADRLRFDFSHPGPLSAEQRQAVEDLVNRQIRKNSRADAAIVAKQQAMDEGAEALFGEKYADEVRVLTIGNFSKELCGGTHVERSGDIGVFKIVSENGAAAGIRRIEALTGDSACARFSERESIIERLCQLLKTDEAGLAARTEQLLNRCKEFEKAMKRRDSCDAQQVQRRLDGQVVEVGGVKVLAASVEGFDRPGLRRLVDQYKARLGAQAVIVLASSTREGKVQLAAGVGRSCSDQMKAGDLIRTVAQKLDGRGGGRADMAEAGGRHPEAVPAVLAEVKNWVQSRLAAAGAAQA